MTRIYISGPMRGYEHFNFPAFYECEDYLTGGSNTDLEVINPARKDAEEDRLGPLPSTDIDITDEMMYRWMRRDLSDVAACDEIILLPGWRESTGARREYDVARWCGLTAWEYDPTEDVGFRLSPVLYTDATVTDVSEPMTSDDPQWQKDLQEAIRDFDQAFDQTFHGGEVRVTNALTGGEKGSKPARYDLLPVGPLRQVAEHYGKGAAKYADRNWERGYDWSLSYAALQRHANAFWDGETYDPETGSHHMAAVVFHALALMEWNETHPELDNRPRKATL